MFSWLWGGGGAASAAPPPVSPALREAQEQLSSQVLARLRNIAPLADDRALATACGFDGDSTLARHMGAAVRSYGEQEDEKAIAADSVVVAFEASSRRPQFASAVLQGGCSTADNSIPLDQVEAVLRDCLRLVEAPGEADDDSASLARALALGLASPGDLGGSSSDNNPASSSSHVTRDAAERWAKQRAGVAIADFLSALMRRLGEEDDGPPKKVPALWPYPPPRLLLPAPSSSSPSNPLLLSPRAALLLAPHVTDPRRRERWRLVFSASLHGKSWSTLQGRLAAAGASAAANVEAHADAAALSAFTAAAGGGGAVGGVGGGGRAARAAAAAAAAAASAASGPRSAAANPDDDDETAGSWSGPPATLVLARDADSGAVFGGATSVAWRKKPDFYGGGAGSSSAFLFALSPRFRLHPLSGINDRVQYLGAGFQSRPNGLGMGGQLGAFGFWLDATLERGHSRPNATYACASLLLPAQAQEFSVADVEVWAMLTPEEDEGPSSSAAKGAAAASTGAATNRGSVLSADAERNFLAVAGKFSDHSAGVRD